MLLLLLLLQSAVDDARVELAAGRAVPGILGSLVSAVDEHGNRWVCTQGALIVARVASNRLVGFCKCFVPGVEGEISVA
jgi:hypothetical protein